jgi:hypothetical protein
MRKRINMITNEDDIIYSSYNSLLNKEFNTVDGSRYSIEMNWLNFLRKITEIKKEEGDEEFSKSCLTLLRQYLKLSFNSNQLLFNIERSEGYISTLTNNKSNDFFHFVNLILIQNQSSFIKKQDDLNYLMYICLINCNNQMKLLTDNYNKSNFQMNLLNILYRFKEIHNHRSFSDNNDNFYYEFMTSLISIYIEVNISNFERNRSRFDLAKSLAFHTTFLLGKYKLIKFKF